MARHCATCQGVSLPVYLLGVSTWLRFASAGSRPEDVDRGVRPGTKRSLPRAVSRSSRYRLARTPECSFSSGDGAQSVSILLGPLDESPQVPGGHPTRAPGFSEFFHSFNEIFRFLNTRPGCLLQPESSSVTLSASILTISTLGRTTTPMPRPPQLAIIASSSIPAIDGRGSCRPRSAARGPPMYRSCDPKASQRAVPAALSRVCFRFYRRAQYTSLSHTAARPSPKSSVPRRARQGEERFAARAS